MKKVNSINQKISITFEEHTYDVEIRQKKENEKAPYFARNNAMVAILSVKKDGKKIMPLEVPYALRNLFYIN